MTVAIQRSQRKAVKCFPKWKGESFQLEKKEYAEVAKIYGTSESSIRTVAKKEQEICVSFAVAPETADAAATVCDKSSVKMEKASSSWVEDTNRKQVLADGGILHQKALSL